MLIGSLGEKSFLLDYNSLSPLVSISAEKGNSPIIAHFLNGFSILILTTMKNTSYFLHFQFSSIRASPEIIGVLDPPKKYFEKNESRPIIGKQTVKNNGQPEETVKVFKIITINLSKNQQTLENLLLVLGLTNKKVLIYDISSFFKSSQRRV